MADILCELEPHLCAPAPDTVQTESGDRFRLRMNMSALPSAVATGAIRRMGRAAPAAASASAPPASPAAQFGQIDLQLKEAIRSGQNPKAIQGLHAEYQRLSRAIGGAPRTLPELYAEVGQPLPVAPGAVWTIQAQIMDAIRAGRPAEVVRGLHATYASASRAVGGRPWSFLEFYERAGRPAPRPALHSLARCDRDCALYPEFALEPQSAHSQGEVRRASLVLPTDARVEIVGGPFPAPLSPQAAIRTVSVNAFIPRVAPGGSIYAVRYSGPATDVQGSPVVVTNHSGFINAAALSA